jgi:hypothetical protein
VLKVAHIVSGVTATNLGLVGTATLNGIPLLTNLPSGVVTNGGGNMPLVGLNGATNLMIGGTMFTNGNVGIGTTSPSALLDIGGFGTILGPSLGRPQVTIADNYDGISGLEMYNASASATADFRFIVANNNKNEYVSVTTPGDGNTSALFGAQRMTSNYIFNNTLSSGTVRNLTLGTISAGDLIFGTTSAERMRILNTGNVGIGTTSPKNALDVIGSASFSGSVTTTNVFNVGGNAGWSGVVAGVITNAVGPHGVNFFIGGGIITNVTSF